MSVLVSWLCIFAVWAFITFCISQLCRAGHSDDDGSAQLAAALTKFPPLYMDDELVLDIDQFGDSRQEQAHQNADMEFRSGASDQGSSSPA